MSETQKKELTLNDIEKMLQKTIEEIQAKEHSIKNLEKMLANARNRLSILKGREGSLKLERMKKRFGVQSEEELMERMAAALDSASDNKAVTAVIDQPDKKTEDYPAKESAADFSKMW